MNKSMKKVFATVIVIVASVALVSAQPGGGGGGNPGGGPPPGGGSGAPIDGGATIFMLSVIGYAYKKIKDKETQGFNV